VTHDDASRDDRIRAVEELSAEVASQATRIEKRVCPDALAGEDVAANVLEKAAAIARSAASEHIKRTRERLRDEPDAQEGGPHGGV